VRPIERAILAERIKGLRDERGLTRQQLADALEISLTAVAGYEQGYRMPKFDILRDLSKFFRVPIEYLVGSTDDKGTTTVNNVQISDALLADFMTKVSVAIEEAGITPQQKRKNLDLLLGMLETLIRQGGD